jgi:flavin reductase (DIM6/NTAB) family NADH-FMN oxidoreductase RutF
MIVDPKAVSTGAMYQHMIASIVPRPIAFVTTVNAAGRVNAAPFSYFNAISSNPPLIGFSCNLRSGAPKDTLRNIREVPELVVNIVSEDMAARIVQASGDWPEEVDELSLTGLTAVPSDLVKAPRVLESPVNFECRLEREVEFPLTSLVIVEILRMHVADEILSDGRIDITKLRPLGRLGGDGYAVVRDVLHLPRPKVAPRVSD